MKYLLIFLLICSSLFADNPQWGSEGHRFINEHAIDHLPPGMSFFQDHRSYIRQHSTDPDGDPLPGYYHYIDIDYYPEFFAGTLPHDLDSLIALYNPSTVYNNGIVPWVIEQWTDSLSTLMATGQWNYVWQVAAELGHYVADSHQPLHLTRNYNGQLTGNYGIHSRYETTMLNQYLSQIPLPNGTGAYWPNVTDSVFAYIDEIYPYVNSIMMADDLASAQDPNYGNTYYSILWQQLGQLTAICVQNAILDLAGIWRTAWENAGSPSPLGIQSDDHTPETYFLAEAYPNPFNPTTNLRLTIPKTAFVTLKIYNLIGQEAARLVSEKLTPGIYEYQWNASGFASGIYFYRLETNSGFVQTKKLTLQK